MTDYRMSFIRNIEERLATTLTPEEIEFASNVIMRVLSDYELAPKCTDVAIIDPENERILRRYCACLLIDGKSEKTIKAYSRLIRLLSETLCKNYTEMTTYDLRFYLACEKARGLSNNTLENTRSYISAFFQWLTNEEIIQRNPAAAIKPVKCKKEIKKPFSDVEIDALRGACETLKERAIVEMLLSTGVRVNELSLMEVEDIDFSNLSVHVRHGKGNKERVTYTTKVATEHLKRYLNTRRRESNALFLNAGGTNLKPCGIRFILSKIAERAGVGDVYPHRFRRTFATNLAARGMDIQGIQKLMGHSDINTTMRYVTTDDSLIRASYSKYIA